MQTELEVVLNKLVVTEEQNKKLSDALMFYSQASTYETGAYRNLPRTKPIDIDRGFLAKQAIKFYKGEK
jgi:hypothetical protein